MKSRSRSFVKSASALGLSLVIPAGNCPLRSIFHHFLSRPATFPDQNAPSTSGAESSSSSVTAAIAPSSSSSQLTENSAAPVLPSPVENAAHPYGGGSSTASSRDTSPCRELSPLVTNLKPPIVVRRAPNGFGFTVHTIRVYYGDTDFYTMHHLVMAVDESGPAYEAGLRPADLITHVNGEPVQGLFHTQVLQLLLNNNNDEHVTLRATPLEHTSIQTGGRKRDIHHSKLAKKSVSRPKKQRKDADKKRKTSLFRRISTKRASAEIQQLTAGLPSPGTVTPSRSCQSFTNPRSDGSTSSPLRPNSFNRLSLSPLDNFNLPQASPQSTSPSSSAPNTPTNLSNSALMLGNSPHVYHHHHHHHHQRPSTLHGLKHKLHSSVVANKSLHHGGNGGSISTGNAAAGSSNRRKSVGHIPLSPLARTPSPSPLPASPTRSPSPLAFPVIMPGHQPGASNTTQSYSPGCVIPNSASLNSSLSSGSAHSSTLTSNTGTIVTAIAGGKKTSFARPKSAEPSSPLLRRALSPDRLHPRSAAETKCSISPLCCSSTTSVSTSSIINMHAANAVVGLKKQRNTNPNKLWTVQSTQKQQSGAGHADPDNPHGGEKLKKPPGDCEAKGEGISQGLTLALQPQSELMPIAEEKDSPVGAGGNTADAEFGCDEAAADATKPRKAGKEGASAGAERKGDGEW